MAAPGEVRDRAGAGGERQDCDGHTRERVALRLLSVTTMRNHRGFTLLEVLVAVVLIGVLSGIAITQYAEYRQRGFDSQVASVVRGVATGEEAYYAEHLIYAGDVDTLDGMVLGGVHITISAGNSGNIGTSFRLVGTHPEAKRTYTWISDPLPGAPNLIETE